MLLTDGETRRDGAYTVPVRYEKEGGGCVLTCVSGKPAGETLAG